MTKKSTFLSKGAEGSVPNELPIDDPSRRRLPPLLRKAWLTLNTVFLRRVSDIGLTPDQYIALRWLTEKGESGLTQRELSDWMTSDPNTIASLLSRMEKAGWVRRSTSKEDRRTKNVLSTEAGRKIFETARERALVLESNALEVFSEKEQASFLDSLEKVAEACIRSSDTKTKG